MHIHVYSTESRAINTFIDVYTCILYRKSVNKQLSDGFTLRNCLKCAEIRNSNGSENNKHVYRCIYMYTLQNVGQ